MRRLLVTFLLLLVACASPPAPTPRPPAPPPLAPAGAPEPKDRATEVVPAPSPTPAGADTTVTSSRADETPVDPTVWRVSVSGAPSRGPTDALVTIVVFAEAPCPACADLVPALARVEVKHPGKVRVVSRVAPTLAHPRSVIAAELALEARAQKGDRGAFDALELLLSKPDQLDDADLAAHARTLGLDADRARRALESHAHRAAVEAEQELAAAMNLSGGRPALFVNGRPLKRVEALDHLVVEEIAKASALVSAGTRPADVYDVLQKDAKTPVPERVVVAAPPRDSAAKGAPHGAPVTIQMFADFQCPFSKRVQPVIDELIAAYPTKVRVVWRHLPLPFHKQAGLAAEAAQEAFRQKGDAGFWAMAGLLFEGQSAPSGLERDAIEDKARKVGLDLRAFKAALDTGRHRAKIEADVKAAHDAGMNGTPHIAINDYFVGGAVPLPVFGRLVKKALGPYEAPAPGSIRPPITPSPASPATNAPRATDGPRDTFGAKHLLVMYQGSRRSPTTITRTKQEARARAEEALAKARRGVPFERLVEEYSDEPGAVKRGGDLGVFPRGAMVPEFQDAVEKLRVGALSGVVETAFGFHLVLRTK